jgi:hypothetical protein
MKLFRRVIIVLLLVVSSSVLRLAFPAVIQSGTQNSNLEELISGADVIIIGTVAEDSSYWNDTRTEIYTSVILTVEENLKFAVSQDRIIITIPGGEVDGIKQWISGSPVFDQGEQTLVFLKKLVKAQIPHTQALDQLLLEEQYGVCGGHRGKFSIQQGKIGNVSAAEVKNHIDHRLRGQAAVNTQLDDSISSVTMSYSYAGYSWPHPPGPVVTYRINENTNDCTGEGTAVQAAAATWNNAGAKYSFSFSGTTSATTIGYNGINQIIWTNLGSGGIVAQTSIWYNVNTNNIIECDMQFNDYYSFSAAAATPTNCFDVQTVALHEFGHFLCLNDLYSASESAKVMYGYSSPGITKRALQSDDAAGIRYIYGTLATTTPTVTNSAGASSITASTARLNGEVTSTGGENPAVHVYWGHSDGSTTPGNWEQDVNLGTKAAGTFFTNISSLTDSTSFYYRCYAVNSIGGSWASSTASFTTLSLVSISVTPDNPTIIARGTQQFTAMGTYSDNSTANLTNTVTWSSDSASVATIGAHTGSAQSLAPGQTKITATFGGKKADTILTVMQYTLQITTDSPLPDGLLGVAYRQTLNVSGGVSPYVWSIQGLPALPFGLLLDANSGVISGTPTAAGGPVTNIIKVSDSHDVTTTAELSISINKAATEVVLTSSTNPGVVGLQVTFTANVTAVTPDIGVPGGTVIFKDGSVALYTGSLDNAGIVNCSLTTLTEGDHNINAVYGGDANFVTSSAAVINQIIVKRGDANGDHFLDMGDAIMIERIILGLDSPTPGADANLDDEVNMGDVVEIERIILGLSK